MNAPQFEQQLIAWYRQNKRDLPWRHTRDPYRIWLSEIILQQTQVVQGRDYYLRITERFPTVGDLAAAPIDELLKLWQGLGYYSRARNLHAAAQSIMTRHNGAFPTTYDEIRALKGVGSYTAAAIASFAFGLSHAAVDGNVLRVLSRFFGIDEAIDTTTGRRQFDELADMLIDGHDPAEHNQAMMEFGALQCVPSRPDCARCPLAGQCAALAQNKVDKLPFKAGKTAVRKRYLNYIVAIIGDTTYLNRRSTSGIWQGLYDFPLIETDHALTTEELLEQPDFLSLTEGQSFEIAYQSGEKKHVLSHQHLFARCIAIRLTKETAALKQYIHIAIDDLEGYPVPRLIDYFIKQLFEHKAI